MAEFQGERFRGYRAPAALQTWGHNPPEKFFRIDERHSKTPHGISQATLSRLRVRRYNKRMFRYKNQTGIFWGLLSLCITLSVFLSQPALLAQGLVIVVSDPTEVVKTNRSALSGSLIFAVASGTTGPGEVVIDYGVSIEDPGEVSGYPDAIEETDLASGILTVQIPQGLSASDLITLDGVRFDMAAADVERVVANLRVAPRSGFIIRENHLSVEVVSRVLPGLEVDLESDVVFILPENFFRPASLTLAIKEGFSTAFSDNTEFNQNVSTRVQIQIEGLPEGVSVTFPESVSSITSDAIFTVLGGSETALPTEDGDRSITYEFQKGRTSDIRVETFKFDYTVEVVTPDVELTDDSPPPERGPLVAEPTAVFLQATLAPGESEECNEGPCVPRYQTEFRPPEDELPLPEFETYFPVSRRVGPLRLQFTNRRDLDLTVRLEALSPGGSLVSGPDIVNPASVTVDRSDQVSVVVEEIFGPGILDVEIGTIAALTRRAEIGSIFLLGDALTLGDGGAASQPPRSQFLLPHISREGEEPFTVVHFFNPSEEADTEIRASLYDGNGEVVSSTDRALGPRGTISESAETFFAVDLKDSQDGYIQGQATGEGVVAFQAFGNEKTINHLAGQATSLRKQSYGIAHIGFGAGLETELNLINSDEAKDAEFRVSVFDDRGQAALAPVDFILEPHEQRVIDLSVLFGLSLTGLLTGSLEIEVLNAFLGPFLIVPSINGSVRFKSLDGRYSATIPLFRVPDKDALYTHVVQDQGFFTGLAIKNRARTPVDGTVEAFDASGHFVGDAQFTLDPGARLVKLLSELIPETSGQRAGGFRVLSPDGAVDSLALFGNLAGDWISTIPGE